MNVPLEYVEIQKEVAQILIVICQTTLRSVEGLKSNV